MAPVLTAPDLASDLDAAELDFDFDFDFELESAVVELGARFGDDPVGLARLAAVAAALASRSFDEGMSPPLMNEVVASLSAASRSLTCTVDVVLDRWDRTHAWGYDGAVSGAAWLSARFNESHGWTRRQIADARRLTSMAATFDALRSGRISRSVALRLADARDVLPAAFDAAEPDLLDAIEGDHARHAHQKIKVWIAHANSMNASNEPDPTTPPEAPSTLSFQRLLDGRLHLQADLDAHAAQIVRTAIENLASKDNDFRRPMNERLADGLVTLAERGLEGGHAGSAQQPHVVATLTLDDLERRTNTSARYADGSPVPSTALAEMLCTSNLHVLLTGLQNEPLAMGRTRRLASLAQRLALAVQWGGCAFPGCDRPVSDCEVHHEHEWEHGGNTDVDDMKPLCHAHHRKRHLEGWAITQLADGTVVARHPDGHVVTDARQRTPTDSPPPAQRRQWQVSRCPRRV